MSDNNTTKHGKNIPYVEDHKNSLKAPANFQTDNRWLVSNDYFLMTVFLTSWTNSDNSMELATIFDKFSTTLATKRNDKMNNRSSEIAKQFSSRYEKLSVRDEGKK